MTDTFSVNASRQACVLCGAVSHDVRVGLVRWRKRGDVTSPPFAALPRCRDHAGCRERVEALGEEWDVVDAL